MPEKDKKRPKPVVEEVTTETPVEKPKDSEIEVLEKKHHEEKAEKLVSELESIQKAKKKKSNINFKLLISVGIISALVAAFVSGGFYVYFTGLQNLANEPKVEEEATRSSSEPTSTPEPTPAPEEEIDLSEYKVNVLNGKGTKGAASAGAKVLESAGFTGVDTGNAGRYDFTDTIIEAKVDIPKNVLEAISEALSEDYTTDFGDNLEDNSEYDIVVTVGSK